MLIMVQWQSQLLVGVGTVDGGCDEFAGCPCSCCCSFVSSDDGAAVGVVVVGVCVITITVVLPGVVVDVPKYCYCWWCVVVVSKVVGW